MRFPTSRYVSAVIGLTVAVAGSMGASVASRSGNNTVGIGAEVDAGRGAWIVYHTARGGYIRFGFWANDYADAVLGDSQRGVGNGMAGGVFATRKVCTRKDAGIVCSVRTYRGDLAGLQQPDGGSQTFEHAPDLTSARYNGRLVDARGRGCDFAVDLSSVSDLHMKSDYILNPVPVPHAVYRDAIAEFASSCWGNRTDSPTSYGEIWRNLRRQVTLSNG